MQKSFPVTGMHCSSCVMNVEELVLEVPGVTDAVASFKKGQVDVTYDNSVSDEAIKAAIVEAGYVPT